MEWREGELYLGALATYWDVVTDARAREATPILVEAARQVGAVQIQTRGTWAGNIVNASPAADGVPALMALGAEVGLASSAGERWVALDSFYTGYRETVKRRDELVVGVRVALERWDVQFFEKVGSRAAQAITKVGAAVSRSEAGGWRVAVNSASASVQRCAAVEGLLDSDDVIDGPESFLDAIDRDVRPIDDVRSTARYRRTVLSRVLYYALRERGVRVEGA